MRGVEFLTVEPGSGADDLRPFLRMVGDARVVGLGEGINGSHEIHRMKHRLVELLAEELGFSAVVLDSGLAETSRVNVYVLEGHGDPADLIRRHLHWGVGTEEVADLVRWMWDYNTRGHGRILLAGCDMQRMDTAATIVKERLFDVDGDLAASVAERYGRVLDADRSRWLSGAGAQAWFPVRDARGRRLSFSAFIRTEDVSDHACIWAWAGGPRGTLVHDALAGRRPRGTSGWRGYRVVLDVPGDASHLSIGCYLAGNGKAWFDGLSIEIDGEPWHDPERIDLELGSAVLRGFWVDPRNRALRDPDVTRTGRPSLRIEPAEQLPECETSVVGAQALARQVLAELEDRFAPQDPHRVLRCARAVVQTLEMRTGGGDAARARSMAENVRWLLDRDPDARIVFWGHNGQVARSGGEIGAFLAQILGEGYVPVGFATGAGSCLAPAPKWHEGLHLHELAPPPPGSFEHGLLETGRPRLILDLRRAPEVPEWAWLGDRRTFRNVSASSLAYEFFEQRIRDDFDLLVWLAESTAARALPREE